MSDPLKLEPWVDAKAISAHLALSRSRVLELARIGRIPSLPIEPDKPNGRGRNLYRFKLSDVQTWADKRSRAWSKRSKRT